MTGLIGVLFLVVVVQTQEGVADDYYFEEQQHFATDLESQCQYDDMVTDETGQNEQYQNHDAVPKAPALKRRRPLNAPCIDGRAVMNISAVVGGSVDLLCTVRQLNEHKVTWSKLGELFPISVDTRLFTPNTRFYLLRNVNATKKNPHWNIRILDVQLTDAGIYSCQMNTHPIKARRIYLQVDESAPIKQSESNEVQKTGRSKKPGGTRKQPTVQPQTESSNDSPRRSGNANLEQQQLVAPNAGPSVHVTGTQDVDLGAQIKLMCVAQGKHGKPPASISWYRNSYKVSTSNPPNASLPARLAILESAKYNELVSWLNIQSAQSSDQGRYTCRTPEGSASLDVQVFRDVGESGQNSPLGSDSRASTRTRLVPSRDVNNNNNNNNVYNNMQAIRSQNAAGTRRHELAIVICALFITLVCGSLQR